MQRSVTIPRDLGDLDVDYLAWRERGVDQIELVSVKLGGLEILPVMSDASVESIIEDLAEPIIVSRPVDNTALFSALDQLSTTTAKLKRANAAFLASVGEQQP